MILGRKNEVLEYVLDHFEVEAKESKKECIDFIPTSLISSELQKQFNDDLKTGLK